MSDKFKHYESTFEHKLPRGLPIIVRVDGQGFSTLTDSGHFRKPFDEDFEGMMNAAAHSIMEYCTEAELAYIQSDEISVVLPPSDDPFLGGRAQKLASLFAAKASAGFTEAFYEGGTAAFDGRAFAVPKREVLDYFVWRQEDAFRNCVHSTAFYELAAETGRDNAQALLYEKSLSEQQELLFQRFDINVNDLPTHRKRGRCLQRVEKEINVEDYLSKERFEELSNKGYVEKGQKVERSEIQLDNDIPRFTKDRRYIDYAIEDPIPPVA